MLSLALGPGISLLSFPPSDTVQWIADGLPDSEIAEDAAILGNTSIDVGPDGTIEILGLTAPSTYSGDQAMSWRDSLIDGTLEGFVQSHANAVGAACEIVGYSTGCMGYDGHPTFFTDAGPFSISPRSSCRKERPNCGKEVSGDVAIEVLATDNRAIDLMLVAYEPFKGSHIICETVGTDATNGVWKTKKLNAGNYTITALAEVLSGSRSETSVTVQHVKPPKGGGTGKERKLRTRQY